ncbi:acetyltransferases [Longilinea arvoryzae]|uniref:Acetyltransferases n=1 Tax=Longilinea arvoryzae TaxID=360412 RepID=A0A0K8MXY3_9CHLR|nr:GNAT family N-acetyltransferase [Longilinea arvoryzae]GAP16119.1 acetyltransferases [Longilinea arvoryzae]
MEKLTASEIQLAAGVFARAFFDDPLFRHFFPEISERRAQIEALYRFRLRSQLSNSFKTNALEGLAIWQAPHRHNSFPSILDLVPGLRMVKQVGRAPLTRMVSYLRWAESLRAVTAHEPYWYLDSLVVDPAFQGRGLARQLIDPVVRLARDAGQWIYLETHNRRNLDIYAHLGFTVVARQRLPGTYIDHFLLRKG